MLVVQHADDCPPALLGGWLSDAGVTLDVRRPYAGDPLPDEHMGLGEHSGLLVLGGPMGADDEADHWWLRPTKALLRAAVRDEVPTLAICLGHQLLAVALGGRVARNPSGRQLGLLPMGWTSNAADDELVGGLVSDPGRCLHWNQDIVTALPAGAQVTAVAPGGEIQAARFGPAAWGIQPHPEVDEAVVQSWASSDDEALAPDEDVTGLVREMAAAHAELEAAWRPLAEAFAALVTGPVGEPVRGNESEPVGDSG